MTTAAVSANHIPVDCDVFRSILKKRGMNQSRMALELGYAKSAISNAINPNIQGWFSRAMATAIQNTYGIAPQKHAYVVTGLEDDKPHEGIHKLTIERIDERPHAIGILLRTEDDQRFWGLYYKQSFAIHACYHILRNALNAAELPENLREAEGKQFYGYVYLATSRNDGREHARVAWAEPIVSPIARPVAEEEAKGEALLKLKREVQEIIEHIDEQLDILSDLVKEEHS